MWGLFQEVTGYKVIVGTSPVALGQVPESPCACVLIQTFGILTSVLPCAFVMKIEGSNKNKVWLSVACFLSFFSVAMIKYSDKSKLRKRCFLLTHSWKAQTSIMEEKPRWQGPEAAGNIVFTTGSWHRGAGSVLFLCLQRPGAQSGTSADPVARPFHPKTIKTIPTACPEAMSQGILGSVDNWY